MKESGSVTKKRWVDYSSDGTSSLISSDNTATIYPQLEKLRKIQPHPEMVWLEAGCSKAEEYEKQAIKKLRNDKQNISVFPSKYFDGFDLKVYTCEAENYLKNKIPGTKNVIVKLSERNFRKEPSADPQDRKQDKSARKKSTGDTQRRSSNNNRHLQYVDKETGKKPDNKQKYDERVLEQNNRKYSKKQANQLGTQLATFRSKEKIKDSQKQVPQKYTSPYGKNIDQHWNNRKKSQPKKTELKWRMKNPYEGIAENQNSYEETQLVKQMSMTSLKEEQSKKSLSKDQKISKKSTQISENGQKKQIQTKSSNKRKSRTKSRHKSKNRH